MRLLESQPEKKQKFAGTTIFSIVLHVGLIFLAVFATARAGVKKVNKERAEKVSFVAVKKEPPPPEVKKEPPPPKEAPKPKPKAPKPQAPQLPRVAAPAPPKGFQVVPPVVNIPTALPAIDLSKATTNADDFTGKGVAGGSATGVEGGTGKAGDKGKEAGVVDDNKTYMEFQVEKAVFRTGGADPTYPSSLASAGIKGQVIAQFVVGENGRYEPGSLKILDASNSAFADAVKKALPGMRFSAAQIGGRKVKQLVQMPFQFQIRN